MKFVNLTPHEVHVYLSLSRSQVRVFPQGIETARVMTHAKVVGQMEHEGQKIPVRVVTYGDVVGLPAPVEGVCYIVSRIAARLLPERADLVFPDDMVRESGTVIGCRAFGTMAKTLVQQDAPTTAAQRCQITDQQWHAVECAVGRAQQRLFLDNLNFTNTDMR